MDVVVLGLDPEEKQEAGQAQRRLFGRRVEELAKDPLGVARRPRGVVHDVADRTILGQRGGLRIAHGGVRNEAVAGADSEPRLGAETHLVGRGRCDVGEARVGHERLRARVTQDVGHLGSNEMMVDRYEVPACLKGRQVHLDHLRTVREQRGDHVALFESHGAQRVDQLVGVAQQLAGLHLHTLWGDEGEIVGVFLGQRPEAEVTHAAVSLVDSAGRKWQRPGPQTRTCSKLRQTAGQGPAGGPTEIRRTRPWQDSSQARWLR